MQSINLSLLYTWAILIYQWDHNYFILWLLADPYIKIYDKSKITQCLVSQNVNFRLNTLLHGALQLIHTNLQSIDIKHWQGTTSSDFGKYVYLISKLPTVLRTDGRPDKRLDRRLDIRTAKPYMLSPRFTKDDNK